MTTHTIDTLMALAERMAVAMAGNPDACELIDARSELRTALTEAFAPDCRTCDKLQDLGDNFACRTWGKEYATCTNRDQYQPAPKLVLWSTE